MKRNFIVLQVAYTYYKIYMYFKTWAPEYLPSVCENYGQSGLYLAVQNAVTYPYEGGVPIGFSLGYPRRVGLIWISSGNPATRRTRYSGAA